MAILLTLYRKGMKQSMPITNNQLKERNMQCFIDHRGMKTIGKPLYNETSFNQLIERKI